MSTKSSRIQTHEKNEQLSVYIDKDFADYKTRSSSAPKTFGVINGGRQQAPIAETFEMALEKELLPYFKDLIALDSILEKFTKNLTVFLSRTEEHCSFNFWSGKSLTGKTTLAKRLCGQEGFAPLSYKAVKMHYHDCFTVKDQFETLKKDWLDKSKTPNNSVIFIDEAEKLLDEKHKLVDEVFAKKFRKTLEDLSRTRKLFFIFMTQETANRENVMKLLDTKLTSLTDFDLKFPEWTTENLLNIILETINSKGYQIEPEAAAELAVHSNQHGMVLEMQGVLQLLEIEIKRSGRTLITENQVKNILKSRS